MRLIGLAGFFALGLTLAPLAAGAQQAGKVWRIGFLTSAACPDEAGPPVRMLSEGLRERGHTVGKTVVFECRRSDEGREDRFRELADDLVGLQVDLIIGVSSAATRALRPATKTIPIVALDSETDPVASGLASSLAKPGGNITGIFLDAPEINGKRLQLLKEAVPRLSRVIALWDASTDPTPLRATETAARSLGLHLRTVTIRSPKDLEGAFRTAAKEQADGVVLLGSALMRFHLESIVDLALRLSFAKTSSRLSGRRPMLSRQAKERLEDCRQEGRPAVRVRRAATEGRRTFFGWGGEQPDGRTGPIVANRLSWIRPPVGRSDGGGHRLRESR